MDVLKLARRGPTCGAIRSACRPAAALGDGALERRADFAGKGVDAGDEAVIVMLTALSMRRQRRPGGGRFTA